MLNKKERRLRRDQLNERNFASERFFERCLIKSDLFGYERNYCLLNTYFGDFVWIKQKIVVEIDGSSHDGKEEYDSRRDARLKNNGFKVLRLKYPLTENQALVFIDEILKKELAINFEKRSKRQRAINKHRKVTDKSVIEASKIENKKQIANFYERREAFERQLKMKKKIRSKMIRGINFQMPEEMKDKK